MIRHVAAVAFAGFAALIVAGCGGPPTTPPGSPAGTDTSSVESATAAFHQALRVNDLETFMSYVADDVFFMPPGEPPVRGHDALRTWMTAFLEQYRTSSLTLADREVHVGGGWAVELGTFEWALQRRQEAPSWLIAATTCRCGSNRATAAGGSRARSTTARCRLRRSSENPA